MARLKNTRKKPFIGPLRQSRTEKEFGYRMRREKWSKPLPEIFLNDLERMKFLAKECDAKESFISMLEFCRDERGKTIDSLKNQIKSLTEKLDATLSENARMKSEIDQIKTSVQLES